MLRPLLISILLLVPVAAPAASIRIESDGMEIVERGEVVEFGIWLDTAPGEQVGFIVLGFGIPASDPWLPPAILLDYRVQPAVASPLELEQFGILAPIGDCAPECFMGLGFLAEPELPFVSNGASVSLGTLLYRPFMRE